MEKDNNWLVEEFDFNNDDPKDLIPQFANELGEVDPAKPAYFTWMCFNNPVGNAVIQIAQDEETGQIIGQNWLIPLRIFVGGETFISTMWVNAFVRRDWRRKGVMASIVRHIRDEIKDQNIDFIVGFANSYSINVARS